MFLLDTNVISEMRKIRTGKAERNVALWAISTPEEHLFLSAVVILELELGTLRAERRDPRAGALLRAWLDDYVLPAFAARILPVDVSVAKRAAALQVPNPTPAADALIAATAVVHDLIVVTRNVADFERTGVRILNPWNGVSA